MGSSDTAPRRELGSLLRSVVKVMTVSDAPDYEQPWQTEGPDTSTGSGVIVDTARGPRILTNAHCVQDHVYVEVRRYGKSKKLPAAVEALGHECDLALLRVDDETFFHSTQPIPIGELPDLSDQVAVAGYPIGGERVSITQGIVSRIDLVQYAQSQRRLLAVQIDAAINPGNSGGPVLEDGKLIGVAFQALEEAEKISYVIPPPVVRHFLQAVQGGAYQGFPELGVTVQELESAAHRRSLGLSSDVDGGVLITRIAYGGSAWEALRVGDVLLEIDGTPITADGNIELRDGEHVDFAHAVARRFVGETVEARVWRQGEHVSCVVRLRPPAYLVPETCHDVRPTYYVYGGILFVPLTRNYLMTWSEPWWQDAPRELVMLYEMGIPTPDRTEVVVLQKVLADEVNQGYHELESHVVDEVQGIRVRSLRHMIEVVEAQADPFVRFGLPSDRSGNLVREAELRDVG